MDSGVNKEDFLLQFYKEHPDSIFAIGDWETELQCASCSGSLDKNGSYLFNQEFPTENTRRRNLALADARCPHCFAHGPIEAIGSNSIYTPIETKEVWFRKLTIDPPTKLVKTFLRYREEPQEQRFLKEYREKSMSPPKPL